MANEPDLRAIDDSLAKMVSIGSYHLLGAMLDVLTRQLGPNFAGAVREEILSRADGLDRVDSPLTTAQAAVVRQLASEPYWDGLTGRRPDWTRFDPPPRR